MYLPSLFKSFPTDLSFRAAAFQKARDRLFPDLPASSIFKIIVERACIGKDGRVWKDSSSPNLNQKQRKKDPGNNQESTDIPDTTGLSPSYSRDPCVADITRASLTFVETPGTEALMVPSSSTPGKTELSIPPQLRLLQARTPPQGPLSLELHCFFRFVIETSQKKLDRCFFLYACIPSTRLFF